MSGKMRLAKSRDSRTRGKTKAPVLSAESLQLKAALKTGNVAFIDYLLGKGYSRETIKAYVYDVDRFTSWLQEEGITPESASYADVLYYIQQKKGVVKQRTLSTALNSIRHYYTYLVNTEQVPENPAAAIKIRGVKRRKLYQILSKQELESLYHHYSTEVKEQVKKQNWQRNSYLATKRNKIIIGLLVYQGVSTSELVNLTVQDIKLREGKIYIAGGRRSNEREQPLEAVQMLDMMEYIMQIRPELLVLTNKQTEQLLVSTGKSLRIHNSLTKLVQKLKAQNGKVNSLKQIRTSVIIGWLKVHNLRKVQYMAGHRFVSSTEAYLANDPNDLQEEITKYHPIG